MQEISQQVTRGSRILHAVTPLSAVNKFITSCNHHCINIYSQMIRCQAIQGERTVFSANGGKLDDHLQKNEADLYLTPYTKTNSKWIKELNAGPRTTKLRRKWHKLHDTGFGNDFVGMTAKAQATEEKIDKLDFVKT